VPGPEGFTGGSVDQLHSAETAESKLDAEFVKDINERLTEYRKLMEETKLRSGLAAAMSISSRGNQYLQEAGLDNSLLANHPERCGQVILNAVNLIYLLSVVLHPFMPSTTDAILRQLNAPARSLPTEFSIDILPGHVLGKADHLFKKIDNVNGEQEKKWQKQFGGDSVVAEQVTPAGPGGHPEGGKVPKAKELSSADKKAEHKAQVAAAQKNKKAAAAAAAAKKTAEEIDLEEKVQAQGKLVAAMRKGTQEGDVDAELAKAKQYKTELAELRARLKAASLEA
jgi:methionyl-tRNA synthetase